MMRAVLPRSAAIARHSAGPPGPTVSLYGWCATSPQMSECCTSFYLSIHLSIYPSIHLSVYLSICLSIYPSIYPSIYRMLHWSTCDSPRRNPHFIDATATQSTSCVCLRAARRSHADALFRMPKIDRHRKPCGPLPESTVARYTVRPAGTVVKRQ